MNKQQNHRYFPLKSKLIAVFCAVSLIPVITITLYFSQMVRIISIRQTGETYKYSATQVGKNLLNNIREKADAAYETANDNDLVTYLTDFTDDDYYQYEHYAETVDGLLRKLQYRYNDMRFHIYVPNEYKKFSGVFLRNEDQFIQKQVEAEKAEGAFLWRGIQTKYRRDYLNGISLVRDYLHGYGKTIGVLEVGIATDDLYKFIEEATLSGTMVFLLDANDDVILSSVSNEEDSRSLSKIAAEANTNETIRWAGMDYLCFSSDIEDSRLGISGWRNVHFVPLNIVEEGANKVHRTGGILALVLSVLAISVLGYFANSLTKRIHLLTDTMSAIENGNRNAPMPITGNDEIYDLGCHFEKMMKQLNYLMNEIYEAELAKQRLRNEQKEAQLLALQSQINPHYLFNTMETIRMNLLLKGDRQTATVIRVFAESFREMMDESSPTCSLAHEVEFLKKYFFVQKYRYEEKIDLDILFDESLDTVSIPKFLLQPLVENAIYHGLEGKEGNGKIKVSVEKIGDRLQICVEDDGIGMEKKELDALRESFKNPVRKDNKYYALRNISRKLSLSYGPEGQITIDSEKGRGTRVVIYLACDDERKCECRVSSHDCG